jgi:primary-amine oxidase
MVAAALVGNTALCAADAHPLDGLSPAEISAVVEILKAEGKVTANARYPLIELKEPDKSAVLTWRPGDREQRVATVNVKVADGVYKGEVDLTAHKVLAWDKAAGQPMILFEEFIGVKDLVLANPEFDVGLEKRGLKTDRVICLPLTAGAFGTPDEAGRRLMKVPCYVKPEGSNFYAKPIEGLFAVVDLAAKQVLIWRFRWRVDKRPGVVLSEIEVNDGKDWRSVLYQAHLSEVFVHYMDPDIGWYWRTYMDSGEYGFGIFLSPLRRGVDCPPTAVFLPAVVHSDDGSPIEIPDTVCVFERNIGDPAWRHYEVFAQASDKPVPTEGRPATELVVRSASELGNYDYLIDYVFQQDGMIPYWSARPASMRSRALPPGRWRTPRPERIRDMAH